MSDKGICLKAISVAAAGVVPMILVASASTYSENPDIAEVEIAVPSSGASFSDTVVLAQDETTGQQIVIPPVELPHKNPGEWS